jgi:arylsulfatase A-like enzyme
MIPRRQLLQGALGTAAVGQQKKRPNIVFVLVDDLRWDGLSCLGHPYAKTPHLDRLAREGATFRNAFVTTPLCSPSRACFLTGMYASRHGVVGNEDPQRFNPISHQLKTWPQQLQKAGYRTGFIGKLHMGNDDSPRKGFDHWVSFRGQGQYIDPAMNVNGNAVKRQGYMTDILNEHALEFMSGSAADRPFAMILAHKAVHGPFTPAARHEGLYEDQVLPKTANRNDDLTGKPMLQLPAPARAAAARRVKQRHPQ